MVLIWYVRELAANGMLNWFGMSVCEHKLIMALLCVRTSLPSINWESLFYCETINYAENLKLISGPHEKRTRRGNWIRLSSF